MKRRISATPRRNRRLTLAAENIAMAFRAIRSNKLRSSLTIAIIALGITSLVGILTAVSSMDATLRNAYSRMGAGIINIRSLYSMPAGMHRIRNQREISRAQAERFTDYYSTPATVSIFTTVLSGTRAEAGQRRTNPTTDVIATDGNYLRYNMLELSSGRGISSADVEGGRFYCILGDNVARTLFEAQDDPVGQTVHISGRSYIVIGVTAPVGNNAGGSMDDNILVPYTANRILNGNMEISSFVAKARVMYPRGIARKYSGKPSRIDDEYTSVDFDMYEDGYLQAKAITSTGNISGPYVYAAPRGSTPPALTTPLDAAWYYLGFGGGGTKLLAFQVDSTGKIVASTEIQPAALPQYALTISIQIGTDRTDTDCYAIEYSIVATPDAIDLCNKIRVTINTPETNNSLNYGFQAYNPDNTMYAPRASSGSARSIVMSTDADTTVVVRGIRRSSAAGGTWLDLLQGNPDGYVTDVNELRTAIVEAYCTIEDMGNGSSWGQISPSVEIVFAKNYVNTGMRI